MADNALTDILGRGLDIFGTYRATERQLAQERAYYNSLNGSGAVNQAAADNAPMSLAEFLFGRRGGTVANAGGASDGGMIIPLLLVVLAVAGGWWLWKKFS